MSKKNLNQLIEQLKKEITGFISTDVVDIESGLSVAGGSISQDFDSEMASASYADVVKANENALRFLGGDTTVGETEDILITTSKAYLLLLMFPGKKYYHGLAISRDGNLAFARIIMKKYQPLLIDALPDR